MPVRRLLPLPPLLPVVTAVVRCSYSALVGKWHIGSNPAAGCLPTQNQGFDYFFGLPYSHEEGFPGPAVPESLVFPPIPVMQNESIVQQPVDLDNLTPTYTAQTLALLDMLAGKPVATPPKFGVPAGSQPKPDQPFFLHVAYEECHVPLFAATAFQNRSRRGHYGDALEQMDASIGAILDKLEETGLADSTTVIFSSDQGAWLDAGSGLSKGSYLNGGSNVRLSVCLLWWGSSWLPAGSHCCCFRCCLRC